MQGYISHINLGRAERSLETTKIRTKIIPESLANHERYVGEVNFAFLYFLYEFHAKYKLSLKSMFGRRVWTVLFHYLGQKKIYLMFGA